MQQQSLNKCWQLHEAPLAFTKDHMGEIRQYSDEWMECDLPADVRMPLIKNGIIKDPVKSDYCLESEWIEKRSWWFVKHFDLSNVSLEDNDIIELFIERLDTKSDIFLNGTYLGSHNDVHIPFIKNVQDLLLPASNELIIRVTTGLEDVTDQDLSEIDWAVCTEYDNGGKYRGDRRRAFVRRPAYTVGWDWAPRVVTCGITGDVIIKGYKSLAIRDVSVVTCSIDNPAVLDFTINIENLDIIGSCECDLHINIKSDDKLSASTVIKRVLLTSGINYVQATVEISDPKLWWPNGYGEQPLYSIDIQAEYDGGVENWPVFLYGIRTVQLDTLPIDDHNRHFTFVVNNVPVFAKGGDWIPNDSIYARVTDEKIDILLSEAKEANFNCLRIWGGGLYERDHFYEICDKAGFLLWHDFMFACSTYPDHQEWFRNITFKEMDYQTRRLRNHPCICLFCGTNENHWLFNKIDTPKWNIDITYNHQYGLYVPNVIAKEVMNKNCPTIPYWNSSPYGGKLPNDDSVGDVHRWRDAFMSSKMDERINLTSYDNIHSKFVSEYGYIGPCCLESMREYLDLKADEPIVRSGRPWEMHLNVFEKETVYAGIEKHYLDRAEQLSIEDYILYGGMVHKNVLEYSLESIRFKDFCSGGIFWMYNDTWGEVGWTIIDYYLRRKPGFYGVKRALAHKKAIIREQNGNIIVQGCNDGPESLTFTAEYGYVSFDGTIRDSKKGSFTIAPHARTYLLEEVLPDRDYRKGSIVFIPDLPAMEPVMLIKFENRNLIYDKTPVQIMDQQTSNGKTALTIFSKAYAHGVYIQGNYQCSDNFFDLIPGQVKTVIVNNPENNTLKIQQVR